MEGIRVINKSSLLGKEIDVYGTADEPLFRASDVAEWLGMSNVTDMVSRVDQEELTKLNLGSRSGETWFLTEDGLYEVLMQSRKPIEQMDASIPFTGWGAKLLNNIHKFMREYLDVSNYLSTFVVLYILQRR